MPQPWKHPKTGAYYLNVRIPADVLAAYPGKSHIQKSLRTKARKEAEKRLCEEWLKLQREFEHKRRQKHHATPLTDELADALAQNWLAELLEEDDLFRIEEGPYDKTIPRSEETIDIIEPTIRRALAQGRGEEVADEMEDWLDSNGYSFERGSLAYKKTAYAFLKAFASSLEAERARNRGISVPTPTATALPKTLTLKPIIERFLEGKNSRLEKWRKAFAALEKFASSIGEDRAVATIKQADVLEYFDTVQHLPSERGGKKRPKGIPIRELVTDTVTMAPATFENNYVAPIRVFLRWAINARTLDVRQVAPRQTNPQKRSEFLDHLLLFAVFNNHVILMQSHAWQGKIFESYLNWFLGHANVVTANRVELSDVPPAAIRKKAATNDIKAISFRAPVIEIEDEQHLDGQKTKPNNLVVTERKIGAEIIRSILGDDDFQRLQIDKAAGGNLRVDMKIFFDRETTTSGQKTLNNIARALRNTDLDDDDVRLEIPGVGTVKGSELKLTRVIPVQASNGIVPPDQVFPQMATWIHDLIKNQLVE
ncbi:MAG: hypothetical protein EPO47_07785 [Rugosibacter sp.]|nr:MAG: hypothetical protein EPO47_07785 [Rugosibacter sp.]